MTAASRPSGIGSSPSSAVDASSAIWTTSWRFISRCARRITATDGMSADAARDEARRQLRQRHVSEGADAATCGRFLRSKACARTCATRCARFASRPASPFVAVLALADRHRRQHRDFQPGGRDPRRALPYRDPRPTGPAVGQRACARESSGAAPRIPTTSTGARSRRASKTSRPSIRNAMTLAGSDEPERIQTEFVAAPYFSLLGVSPARGRVFEAERGHRRQPRAVVVLSDGFWKRRFGADPQIIGRTLTLSARRGYTVVGVMPPGFKGLSDTAELWVPFAMYAPPRAMMERGSRGFAALARLKPGVTVAAAQNELDAISRRLEQAYPNTNEKRGGRGEPARRRAVRQPPSRPSHADGGGRVRPSHRLRQRGQPA